MRSQGRSEDSFMFLHVRIRFLLSTHYVCI